MQEEVERREEVQGLTFAYISLPGIILALTSLHRWQREGPEGVRRDA